MWYIETIKKNLNPTSGMRKPEIQGLCVTHNIEYLPKDTIPVLTEKLLEAGVLEIPSGVNIIKINFEETPEIIQTFLEIYKEILNRSYYFFIEKTLKFLPNPKADFTGIQTWQEFKMEVISEINPIEDYMTAFDEKSKIKFEF